MVAFLRTASALVDDHGYRSGHVTLPRALSPRRSGSSAAFLVLHSKWTTTPLRASSKSSDLVETISRVVPTVRPKPDRPCP
jgi:hypothetical protein